MLFFSSSISGLIQWCRALKHGLRSGLPLSRVFQMQANKGPRNLRGAAEKIVERLEKGDSLEDSLEIEGQQLPKLFRDLAAVGEQTGHLPEAFSDLADYYELQQSLGRKFRSQITWPVFEFFAAVGVIAFLIWVLGEIAGARGGEPIQPIGFGLTGGKGAVTFLLAVGTLLGLLYGTYKLFTRVLRQGAAFEGIMLRVPVIGPCVQAFALGRFCLALRMTLESAMPPADALRQSLRATGNSAYSAGEDRIVALIKAGREINEALASCPAFPREFVEIVAVAEVSGQIPEMMIRQGELYREEAAFRLEILTKFAGYGVWFMVASFIIWAIFNIASIYVGTVNQAAGI
jgi:type IV pilus assembly protein PilC